jgi:ferredoxin
VSIRSAVCTACMECVAVCPAEGALAFKAPRKRVLSPLAVAATIGVLFLGTVLFGRITKHWSTGIPEQTYIELVQHADEISHP